MHGHAATVIQHPKWNYRLCILLALVWFGGCTPRADLLPDAAALAGDVIVPVYVGTTRAQEAEGAWAAKIAGPLTYARVDVNVPARGAGCVSRRDRPRLGLGQDQGK